MRLLDGVDMLYWQAIFEINDKASVALIAVERLYSQNVREMDNRRLIFGVPGGERMEIAPGELVFYDAAGVARIRVGNLGLIIDDRVIGGEG